MSRTHLDYSRLGPESNHDAVAKSHNHDEDFEDNMVQQSLHQAGGDDVSTFYVTLHVRQE